MKSLLFSLIAILIFSATLSSDNIVINIDKNPANNALQFSVDTPGQTPDKIHWQISKDPSFINKKIIIEDLDIHADIFTLNPNSYNLLKKKKDYFFRTRVKTDKNWSKWSEPIAFSPTTPIGYQKPNRVKEDVWNQTAPYFLPDDHPIKPVLDEIFSKSRVILSEKTLKQAGFLQTKPRKYTHLIVTRHPEIKGYIFKIYLDAQRYYKQKPEYIHFLQRILGRDLIENEIEKNNWSHLFKVPKKWIYPLAEEPSPPKEFIRKNFILVEEDMDILSDQENLDAWKSEAVTEEKLFTLFQLLSNLGLRDCTKPDNIPFSNDGKIAFVDTQTTKTWPLEMKKFSKYLSNPMRSYWESLYKTTKRKM